MKRVICIDDSIRPEALMSVARYYQNWVKKGEMYTIREVLDNDGIVDGVLLDEVTNAPIYIELLGRYQEPAFGLFRFADVIEEQSEEVIHEEIFLS